MHTVVGSFVGCYFAIWLWVWYFARRDAALTRRGMELLYPKTPLTPVWRVPADAAFDPEPEPRPEPARRPKPRKPFNPLWLILGFFAFSFGLLALIVLG